MSASGVHIFDDVLAKSDVSKNLSIYFEIIDDRDSSFSQSEIDGGEGGVSFVPRISFTKNGVKRAYPE